VTSDELKNLSVLVTCHSSLVTAVMLPEISRRCLGCGAAVRAQARFCPQCGKVVGEAREKEAAGGGAETSAPGDELGLGESWKQWEESIHIGKTGEGAGATDDAPEPAVDRAPDVVADAKSAADARAASADAPPSVAPAPDDVSAPDDDASKPLTPAPPGARQKAGEAVPAAAEEASRASEDGAPLARPRASVAEGRRAALKESLRPRVERVREASRARIEDAAEDSGLRFVLIALFFFALFLLLLYLNKVLR
jgi:hypothetical protein